MRYIGEDGVSAYGTLMYVQFVFIAVFIGYSIGCAPIIGYNYGAQNHSELKNMLRKSIVTMGSGGVLMAILAFVFARPLAAIFVGYDEELLKLTTHAFYLFAFSFVFAGFNIFSSAFFTALGNGGVSAAISFIRTMVFQTACVLLLPVLFGVDGIWWAIGIAELCAFLISVSFIYTRRTDYMYI